MRAEVEAELAGHGDTDYDFSSEFEELGMDDIGILYHCSLS